MKNLKLNNVFIPSSVPSKKLMIILHGRGDSSAGFTWLPPFINKEDMNYLLLDAPNDYYGGYSWYDLAPNQEEGILDSSQILTDICDELFEEEFDVSQSFLFGFSQGSLLTFEFGARYQKVFAGYMAISGYIYNAEKLLVEMNPKVKNASWLCTHGTEDAVLPYYTSKAQVKTLQDGGFNIDFKTYEKEHNIDREELDMLVRWVRDTASSIS
ncbi:MAG: Serine esterase [uncultured Sulfurovum sp.]|uniref:Serine esterase n=1 Tax=uncultured Sulfurovum sp. TaxID=269237 RepID=A0A6S6TUZ5_9BACT|nr:MAG: Serine esterase [uncultured Sulfurovum sp.]